MKVLIASMAIAYTIGGVGMLAAPFFVSWEVPMQYRILGGLLFVYGIFRLSRVFRSE